jgi:hypothetical protein
LVHNVVEHRELLQVFHYRAFCFISQLSFHRSGIWLRLICISATNQLEQRPFL